MERRCFEVILHNQLFDGISIIVKSDSDNPVVPIHRIQIVSAVPAIAYSVIILVMPDSDDLRDAWIVNVENLDGAVSVAKGRDSAVLKVKGCQSCYLV